MGIEQISSLTGSSTITEKQNKPVLQMIGEVVRISDTPRSLEIYEVFYGLLAQKAAFLSPALVKAFSAELSFVSVKRPGSGELVWMQPIAQSPSKTGFEFFGEYNTDFIRLLFSNNSSYDERLAALTTGLKLLAPSALLCKKFKLHSTDIELLQAALKSLGYAFYCMTHISSPIAEYSLESEEGFKKIFSKSTIRNLHNRLHKQAVVEFEAIESISPTIDSWVADFCDMHEWRWSNTPTPSRFASNEERQNFGKRVSATLSDGCGVLFSLKVNGQRKSTVYALKEGKRLIYHQIANEQDPNYYKFSLYKILIKYIGEWMREREMSILDFGIGGETYKLEFATEFEPVAELYASKNKAFVAIKQRIRHFYLNNKSVQGNFLKFRHALLNLRRTASFRFKKMVNLAKVAIGSPRLYLKKGIAALSKKKSFFYALEPVAQAPTMGGFSLVQPNLHSLLRFYEREILLPPFKRGGYIAMFRIGDKRPWALMDGQGNIACLGWVAAPNEHDNLPANSEPENCLVLSDFITAKHARGKGLYSLILRAIAAANPGKMLTIYANDWNTPSQRGIEKAGFKRYL